MDIITKRLVLTGFALLGAALLAALGCSGGESSLKSVTFMAGFKPQANLPFVAAYVAQEKGYFSEQGLDVDIKHSTGQHLTLLMSGDVDFTTADANSVLKRRSDPGLPIKAIALFGQRGQQAFIALEKSGIRTPKDWEGKTFGYKISVPPDYLAIIEASVVDRSKVREVRVGFDPRVLTEEQVDVLAVFKSNEPDTLRGLGFDVTVFDAADFGVPTLGLTYITREDLIDTDPDTVKRFVKATMKGLEFAFENTEETLDIVMRFAEGEDREHMRFMLLTEREDAASLVTRDAGLGWMTTDQWQAFHDSLLAHEALENPVDVAQAFTTRFLEQVYDGADLIWP